MASPGGLATLVRQLEGRVAEAEFRLRQLLEEERREREAGYEELRRELVLLRGSGSWPSGQRQQEKRPLLTTLGPDASWGAPWWGEPEEPEAHAEVREHGNQVTGSQLDRERHELAESVWDACLFIGLPCLGVIPSVVSAVLVLASMIMQMLFCYMVCYYLTDDPFSPEILQGLLRFRTTVAHSSWYADPTSRQSLAAQVCEMDQQIPWASLQASIFSSVKDLLGNDNTPLSGLWLCLLALALWGATMLAELDNISSMLRGLWCLPVGPTSVTVESDDKSSTPTLALTCISRGRWMLLVVLVALPRWFIALSLLYFGSQFLCFTDNLRDLIQNAVALGFIVEIDDLLFKAFAPRRVRALQAALTPLMLTRSRIRRQCPGLIAFLKLLFLAGWVAFIYVVFLAPFYGRVWLAHDILCSGNVDFVYATNAATGVTEVTRSEPNARWNLHAEQLDVLQLAKPKLSSAGRYGFDLPQEVIHASQSKTLRYKIVGDVGTLSPKDAAKVPLTQWEPQPEAIKLLSELTVLGVEAASRQAVCSNGGPAQTIPVFRRQMERLFPDADLTHDLRPHDTCRKFSRLCWLKNMTRLRALCPVSCECYKPITKSGFYGHPAWGCPTACHTLIPAYLEAAASTGTLSGNDAEYPSLARCVDSPPDAFTEEGGTSLAAEYIKGAFAFLSSRPEWLESTKWNMDLYSAEDVILVPEQNHSLAEYMTSPVFLDAVLQGHWEFLPGIKHPRGLTGCAFWTSWEVVIMWGIDFCNVQGFHSIRPICPVSCGCRRGDDECPLSCGPEAAGTGGSLGIVGFGV